MVKIAGVYPVIGTYTGVEILCSISSSKSLKLLTFQKSHKTTIMINVTLLLVFATAWDQKGISYLKADQGIQTNSAQLILADQHIFLSY